LILLLLLAGCATVPRGASTPDRIIGVLVLAGTEQPITGVRITLTPSEPLASERRPDPIEVTPLRLSTIAQTGELGDFVITALNGPDGPRPLLRGWAYELRADADGFYSASQRIEVHRGDLVTLLEIEVVDEGAMSGQQLIDLSPDAVHVEKGGLIEEVLRRIGR
jgi:hypothetical protein